MASEIKTVLIVEDEPLIRMTVVDELQDAGLHVFEADNADDALKILAGNPGIHALFTDVDMPGSMNGVQLAQAVRIMYPQTSLLVASGYLRMPRGALPEDVRFFSKPYDIAKVIESIRSPRVRSAA